MSAFLEVKLSDEQLDLLAERIAVKMADMAPKPKPNAPLSMEQAAKLLKVSRETVRTRIRSGMIRPLPGFGMIRISPAEIERLINA